MGRFAAILALACAAPALAQVDPPAPSPLGWGANGSTLVTRLSGGRTVPGPGDSDGTGSLRSEITPRRGQLCYELVVQNLSAATRVQIHEGGRLRTGASVLELAAPVDGRSRGCVKLSGALALRMVRRPWDYYVSVSTADYPAGAIRGQVGQ